MFKMKILPLFTCPYVDILKNVSTVFVHSGKDNGFRNFQAPKIFTYLTLLDCYITTVIYTNCQYTWFWFTEKNWKHWSMQKYIHSIKYADTKANGVCSRDVREPMSFDDNW